MGTLQNLVPNNDRDHLKKRCDYEVLCFYTNQEYQETPNEEKYLRKKIFAKFRDYQEALEYAKKKSKEPIYYLVILRS